MIFFFIRYVLYISNYICFPGFLSENPLSYPRSPCSPTHPLLSWHFLTMGHQAFTGPRASPPIDVQQGHPLLMPLEPYVPPCVLFSWWFSPWELCGYRLVHIVVPPVRLQTPSAPSVLSLTPPLGTLCSVQWLSESTYFCICQALLEPLSANTCWHPQ